MIIVTDKDIGRRVRYTDYNLRDRIEEGIITSFNDHYILVNYSKNPNSGGSATDPRDLEYI
jgi:hypothetical protein